ARPRRPRNSSPASQRLLCRCRLGSLGRFGAHHNGTTESNGFDVCSAAPEDKTPIRKLADIIIYDGLADTNHRKTASSKTGPSRCRRRVRLKQGSFVSHGCPSNEGGGDW